MRLYWTRVESKFNDKFLEEKGERDTEKNSMWTLTQKLIVVTHVQVKGHPGLLATTGS